MESDRRGATQHAPRLRDSTALDGEALGVPCFPTFANNRDKRGMVVAGYHATLGNPLWGRAWRHSRDRVGMPLRSRITGRIDHFGVRVDGQLDRMGDRSRSLTNLVTPAVQLLTG